MDIEEARRRARSGPMLLLIRRAFALAITFASTITIARLVPPAAYGLANMAIVLLAFAQVFRDFGLTKAVLRKQVVSDNELSFIFWFNAAATLILAALIAALSPFAATFYREPIVFWIVLVSLIGFVSGGLAGQHRALLERELRFGAIAIIDSAALLAGFVTTLTLAILFHDVWSIVLGSLVQSVVGAILTVTLSGWRPSRPRRTDDAGSLLRFGANSSIFSISVFVSNNAGPVLIGHFLGAALLGQYNRADALFRLPFTNVVQPITQTVTPLLTRLSGDAEEYRSTYVGLVRKLCIVLFPASVILAFSAAPLTQALLGDNWAMAGRVLAVLAPALVAIAVASAAGDLFVTQDRARELRIVGLVEMAFRAGAILLAVRYGLVATALAFTLSTMVAVGVRIAIAGRSGPVSLANQLRATVPGIPVALGAAAGCLIVRATLPADLAANAPLFAAATIASGTLTGLLVVFLVPMSRHALHEVGQALIPTRN